MEDQGGRGVEDEGKGGHRGFREGKTTTPRKKTQKKKTKDKMKEM